MIPNDILRRLRYALKLTDKQMIAIFKLAGHEIPAYHLFNLMRKEDEEGFVLCHYDILSLFLDGLIIDRRGKQEGREPVRLAKGEKLSNNEILRKIKIALELKDTDIIDIMKVADFTASKGELSAIFRRTGHRNYKECGNQFLRNFLQGLALKYRKPEQSKASGKTARQP